jgi:hypothetical protein
VIHGRRAAKTDHEEVSSDLADAIERHIHKNGERYAYDRCGLCGCTWFGPRLGRKNPESERHNITCPVPRWRKALQKYRKLRSAVEDLYYAANWTADRECDADALWTRVRDAAGFTPGETAVRLAPPSEQQNETPDAADPTCSCQPGDPFPNIACAMHRWDRRRGTERRWQFCALPQIVGRPFKLRGADRRALASPPEQPTDASHTDEA